MGRRHHGHQAAGKEKTEGVGTAGLGKTRRWWHGGSGLPRDVGRHRFTLGGIKKQATCLCSEGNSQGFGNEPVGDSLKGNHKKWFFSGS